MQELLKNAWQGWLAYTAQGKYVVLLLVVLLFLWFRREKCKEELLPVYTTIMAICCICPITAAVLMKYQTLFYRYEWIWSYVPLTLLVAYGVVIFLHEQWEQRLKEDVEPGKNRFYMVGLSLAVIVLIALCGRMGRPLEGTGNDGEHRSAVKEVLGTLEQNADGQEICLWAPREVMEAARGLTAEVRLVYGRNMWEAALGAYSYEVYSETEELLYLWMSNAEQNGSLTCTRENGTEIDAMECVQAARALGVNKVLLPDNVSIEELQALSNKTGHAVQQLCGYYLLTL